MSRQKNGTFFRKFIHIKKTELKKSVPLSV